MLRRGTSVRKWGAGAARVGAHGAVTLSIMDASRGGMHAAALLARYAVNPPSIVRLAPVTKPASGPARYATIAAISSAAP